MTQIKIEITSKIKGMASMRLFELGKRDANETFLIALYNEGIASASDTSKKKMISRVLRFILSSYSEQADKFNTITQEFNSSRVHFTLIAESACDDAILFRALGECFCLFPVKLAVATIVSAWNINKQNVSSFSNTQKSDKKLETAWGPMLAALGLCAATDENYINFKEDIETEEKLNPLYLRRKELIEERQPLFDTYKEIYRKFDEIENQSSHFNRFGQHHVVWKNKVITISDFNNFTVSIKRIDEEVNSLSKRIDKLENHLSAGNLLIKISSNSQRYHAYLRQYAVIGLMALLKSPFLENSTKVRISEHLQSLMQATKDEKQFRTFEIRIAPDTSYGELLHLFRVGISFLTQRDVKIEYNELPIILKKLMSEIPNVFDFLSKYPLRLVLPEDKYRFYGVYSSTRYDLERWTRFHGELYIGEVEERYFELDDLTRPNSMGISVFALQDKFVALPTIWHEYQHYGEKGIKEGNENEMSVYALENIFLRRQIMDYIASQNATTAKSNLNNILEGLQKNDPGAYWLLSLNMHNSNSYQSLKNIIESNYPERQLPIEIAKWKAQLEIKKQDDFTIEANLNNFFWHPEIKWALLNGTNSELNNKLNRILVRTFTQINVLSNEEWIKFLSSPSTNGTLKDWKVFSDKYKLGEYFEYHPPYFISEENITPWLNRI